ncbi:MAG: NADH-quinone oxidoreductase subunit J family protein [Paracoccus sp. (in: a-proteobacteria)]|uniref:NADH-quinone oxidoreductase subunit J family protein n=2 Tax=Paracoccus sp. TaxID=267 RepID=UPI000C42D44D|nr:NADH-quinone oxidoreductase subunit J [uncultured Paracoccus sp.]MBA48156.1 NADH dehydrogenase subunit [Paracoccus sp. (in: a-proteobacteria)]|tara:strand:+ start:10296 stop:11006 length:711 start_codon:yes stop_codon:yes gene_type:complete
MTMTDVAFYLLSGFAIWTGWRVFRVDSMIRATFLLLLSFTSVGLIGLLLSASYLGAATIFMMAVEMMVMGLFMVMFMMNPAGLNPMMMVHQHRLSIVAGLLIFAAMTGAVLLTPLPSDPVAADRPVLRDLGIELLGDSMLIFETAGVTLLATMLGAVVLSSRRGRFGPTDAGSVPPGLSAGGPPAGRQPKGGGSHGGHGGHGGQGGKGAHDGHGGGGSHGGHGKNGGDGNHGGHGG